MEAQKSQEEFAGSQLVNFVYKETCSIKLLNSIIKDIRSKNDKNLDKTLDIIYKLRSKLKDNKLEVSYSKSKKYGRVYPRNLISLSQVSRPYRHTLCKDYYYDIDLINAQPSILLESCIKGEIPCVHLQKYIDNRSEYLDIVKDTYKIQREEAKQMICSLMNGGYALRDFKELPLLAKLKKEFDNIFCILKESNKELFEFSEKKTKLDKETGKKDYENIRGTFMAFYLQELECGILEQMVLYVKDKYNTDEIILCHDGFMIPKHILGDYKIHQLTDDLEQFIGTTFDFENIRIKNKEMDEALDIEIEEDETNTENNNEYEYEEVKHKLEKDYGIFYCESDKMFYKKTISNGEIHYNPHNRSQFITLLAPYIVHEYYEDKKGNCKVTEKSFFSLWEKDENRLTIEKFVYDVNPNFKCPKNQINLWNGFAIERINYKELEFEKQTEILSLIDIFFKALSNNNVDMYNYLINWIASIIQKPHEKLIQVPLIQSNMGGTGKSTYYKFIGAILGDRKCCRYVKGNNGFTSIKDTFNSNLKDCFVYCIEELEFNEGKENLNFLKAFTSIDQIDINEKFQSKYSIDNKIRLIITTNGLSPIPVEKGQRRLVLTDVDCDITKKMINGKSFYKVFYEILENENNCRFIYNHFKTLDISKWNASNIPKTNYSEIISDFNKPLIERFIEDKLQSFEEYKENGIMVGELLKKYNDWCNNNHFSSINSQKFGLIFGKNEISSKLFVDKTRIGAGMKYKIDVDYYNQLIKESCLIKDI